MWVIDSVSSQNSHVLFPTLLRLARLSLLTLLAKSHKSICNLEGTDNFYISGVKDLLNVFVIDNDI
jgi:hypothetical protein